ncbi:discoidin domain-containing protein [Coraliomargarita sp. SDUM461004]|uniref:Discoidin domain-containing protein n=1 Tax=Thalassobacterium sedimentorum TaxID=3041258 RepID=A0ABU1AMT2_9BACT|nr:discoidin domain-containing protein [Coraliomargarita sp. SDUM461004]MDQ8196108.1 discoidin domain-containing protein [Coraliomargarita sp. SDUM461004]
MYRRKYMVIKKRAVVLAVRLWLLLHLSVLEGWGFDEVQTWDQRLAGVFFDSWETAREELKRIETALSSIPELRLENTGGTGGILLFADGATTDPNIEGRTIERVINLEWEEPRLIDLIAIVPARNYDAAGVVLDYGLPENFTVELTGASGSVTIANETAKRSERRHKGYPFVYKLEYPVMATGLRIHALQLQQQQENRDGVYLMAFSEVLCFSNGENVARNAQVITPHQLDKARHWHWQHSFLIDGQTSLGLPEIPLSGIIDIGWLSKDRKSADEEAWIELDLGEVKTVDAICLYPVRRPSLGNIPGFAFPRSFRVQVSKTGEVDSFKTVIDQTDREIENPGYAAFQLCFHEEKARFVRIETTKLWKEFADYPAFLALSEIQVLNADENVALGAKVVSSDRIGRVVAHRNLYWSEASLTDGFGPRGLLIGVADWMLGLDERLKLLNQRDSLLAEVDSMRSSVRRGVISFFVLVGLGGVFVSIILPVRYRWVRKRDIERVRERIAGDLHDEVGSNLGSIQILSDISGDQPPEPEDLKMIQMIAADTVTAVRDIVWLLRPKKAKRRNVAEHLRETGSIMLRSLQWTYHPEEPASRVELTDEQLRDLMLFYREALLNIVRHAEATKVSTSLVQVNTDLILTIKDNGRGMSKSKVAHPSTLLALKQRAQRLNGSFSVVSGLNEGTLLTLTVPIK